MGSPHVGCRLKFITFSVKIFDLCRCSVNLTYHFLSLVGNFFLVLSLVNNIFSPFVASRLISFTPQSNFHLIIRDGFVNAIGGNGSILILLTPIPSSIWFRLRLNLRFSLGRKLSYNSNYDSDYWPVAAENQPLKQASRGTCFSHFFLFCCL